MSIFGLLIDGFLQYPIYYIISCAFDRWKGGIEHCTRGPYIQIRKKKNLSLLDGALFI